MTQRYYSPLITWPYSLPSIAFIAFFFDAGAGADAAAAFIAEELRNTNITIEKSNRHLQDNMILKASILLNGLEIDCCVYLAHVDTKILQPPHHLALFAAFNRLHRFLLRCGCGRRRSGRLHRALHAMLELLSAELLNDELRFKPDTTQISGYALGQMLTHDENRKISSLVHKSLSHNGYGVMMMMVVSRYKLYNGLQLPVREFVTS